MSECLGVVKGLGKAYGPGVLRFFHGILALVLLWAALVEFILLPPYFDAAGHSEDVYPRALFGVKDPRYDDELRELQRLMDVPILTIFLGYILTCIYFRFSGISWIMTAFMGVVALVFVSVNFWASDYFDWRHFSGRIKAILLQVASLTAAAAVTVVGLMWTRRRLPFKIRKFGSKGAGEYTCLWTSTVCRFMKLFMFITISFASNHLLPVSCLHFESFVVSHAQLSLLMSSNVFIY